MATGNTQVGYGATLTWNVTAVAKLTKIGEIGWEIDEAELSTFDAASRFKVIKAGLVDPGGMDIEGALATDDSSGQMAMFTDARAVTSRTCTITMPTTLGTTTFTGTAFIKKLKFGDMTPEGIIPFKATIRYAGATTWSAAA